MTGQSSEIDSSPCPLCGCRSARFHYRRLGMIRCTECSLIRTLHLPAADRVKQIYSESYFRSADSGAIGYDDYIADRSKISRTFQRRLEEIERWTGRKGRLLDVGCATGFSLEVARARGWTAFGVEISAFACEFARRHLHIEMHCGTLRDANLEAQSFDVVTMWDYIEHCLDPVRELELAYEVLKPGGLIALTSPDIASLPARLWGPRWMGIKDEEHLYYFSPPTMRRLLNRTGFELVRLEHAGKYVDIGFFIKRAGLYSSLTEGILSKTARLLRLNTHVLYVNPFDIMLLYGKKGGGPNES